MDNSTSSSLPPSPREADDTSYWGYASQSFYTAADTTYSGLASVVSSLYQDNRKRTTPPSLDLARSSSQMLSRSTNTLDEESTVWSPLSQTRKGRRASAPDLNQLMENPYNSVRGRHSQRTSRSAVRSLLSLVPVVQMPYGNSETSMPPRNKQSSLGTLPEESEAGLQDPSESTAAGDHGSSFPRDLDGSWGYHSDHNNNGDKRQVSDSETASQLAEGTIRAWRDLCLDEAGDLHTSLRFWAHRWERPVLSWLEAGPYVWTSRAGYSHQDVGRKVSQIQAVLARRCAAIGELQEHLLKAGWQRGVAQWGVLGQGGQWAPVVGFDGAGKSASAEESPKKQSDSQRSLPQPTPLHRRLSSDIRVDFEPLPPPASNSLRDAESSSASRVMANVLVQKGDGGGIFVEDPSKLADWSVEATSLVRQQLARAANGKLELPYAENWLADQGQDDEGPIMISEPEEYTSRELPRWALEMPVQQPSFDSYSDDIENTGRQRVVRTKIVDLPLMVSEVSELLNIMEEVMDVQRARRFEQLQPPTWLQRNWYIVASVIPTAMLMIYESARKGQTKVFLLKIIHGAKAFVKDRLRDPIIAIVQELWKGRENFSDIKARKETIEVLQKMIESWLEENHPQMTPDERKRTANAMDVSLIEKTKEESMKTFYEINNVIRMSFIEMQYMKKEMMNALGAMDEMMSANDINMNLAAITPVFLVSYISTRVFRFLYYVFLKLGKSREEVYASFRDVLTDIDRLLVMRDSPPLVAGAAGGNGDHEVNLAAPLGNSVLGRDDLGMLMLLIHECRTIMWRAGTRRFPPEVITSVCEDLAELAGERGPVNVRQQLRIVERMSRTYSFLKASPSVYGFRYSHLRGA